MARLRFPGRPGYRFGRLGVHYGASEPKTECDPGTQLIANIHRGLRYFRELFGDSDEEEFDGFTDDEIAQVAKKLSTVNAALAATIKLQDPSPRKRLSTDRHASALPTTGSRVRIRRSYDAMVRDGLVKRTRTHISPKVQKHNEKSHKSKSSKEGRKPHVKLKTIKIRLGVGRKSGKIIHRGSSSPSSDDSDSDFEPLSAKVFVSKHKSKKSTERKHRKSKESISGIVLSKHKSKKSTERKHRKSKESVSGIVRLPERSLAKQLLVKAKAGRNKLQFVLPTVSSRSSRKIIPNKRFLEGSYGEMTATTVKRVRIEETEKETLVVPVPFETVTSDVCLPVPSINDPAIDPKLSLFDQPLIVEGKRHRKPSLRLIRQLSDDTVVDNKLVLPSGGGIDGLGAVATTKRHGQDILRKAKLRLNQAAMNRSKKALARSLRRKMRTDQKREQRKAGASTSSLQFQPLDTQLSVQISPIKFGVLSPETPVFGAAGLSAVSPFGRDSTDLSPFSSSTEDVASRIHDKKASKSGSKTCLICANPKVLPYRYYGVVSCQRCSRFYRRRTIDVVHGGATYVCDKEGKCTVSYGDGSLLDCIACRYKKCKRFFPGPESMKDVLQKKHSYRSTKRLSPKTTERPKSPDVAESMESVEEDLAAEQTPDDFTPLSLTTTSSTPFTRVKDLAKPDLDTSGFGLSSTIGENESTFEMSSRTDVAGDVPDSPESVSLSSDDTRSRHQPRIKHVCRRACVALGSPATFPLQSELRLSALPNVEKERLLNKPGSPDSDDMSMDEIIRQARDDKDVVVTIKRTPNKAFSALVPRAIDKGVTREPSETKPYKAYKYKIPSWGVRKSKRKMRCRTCKGCLATECGKCPSCFGLVQCIESWTPCNLSGWCIYYSGEKKVCDNCSGTKDGVDKPKFGGRGVMKKACVERICVQPSYMCSDIPAKTTTGAHSLLRRASRASSLPRLSESEGGEEGSGEAVKGAPPDDKKSPIAETGIVKHRTTKVKADKQGVAQRMSTRCPSSQSSQKRTVAAISAPSRSKWSVELSRDHSIDVAVTEDYDIDVAWKRGIALVSSSPLCLRNVCLLCGSAGQELIYCHVCCEPFHQFCLEEEERPHDDQLDNWCCRRCLFCHVCGLQNNCDRCQETYHPECLGPNYPTKPSSKKRIWVCTKCVKCKSCGATSPGEGRNAVWTHDFSLCYMCGQLMDKGNFCPVCHKCYSDDDWDSKMIQCSSCECWVHARCEGLTDEMYEIVSFMSEGMTFYCHVCQPTRPVGWQRAIDRLRDRHLGNVLTSLLGCERGKLLHTIPASLGSKKNAEEETKEGAIFARDPPTSSSTTAMDTDAADIAKEPVVVSVDMLPLSVAKESCAAAIETLPGGIANGPCDVTMDALPDAVAKEPSIDSMPDGDAGNSRTSSIDGIAGELLGNYTVAFDALLTDSSNETCPVAESVVSPEVVPSVIGENSADDVDSSHNDGLRGFIRTCIDNVGCGSDGETECAHNRRECDKESPTCGPGEGCDRVEGEGGVSNGPCTEGHQEKEPTELCVEDARTEDACGVDEACDAETGCDGSAFNTGDQGCSTGVMSCGGDTSAQACGVSDVITASVGAAATLLPRCPGGSTGSPGCDSRAIAQKSETSDSCLGDTDVASANSCLEGNCENKEPGPKSEGSEEACTKTANCCECETGTAKTCAVPSSALEINVGHGSLGVNSLEHVMSPCSSSTLTAPDVSPLIDTDSQEEFNECVPSEESVLPKREVVADRLGKEVEEKEEKLPRDLGGVRAKLAKNGYDSIEAFSDDITRIIQDDMSHQEAAQIKMLTTSLQSLFVKQMDKYFPWFCVASSRHWFKNRHCPDGVLPQAVLPPTSDHTYAQWLQRAKTGEDACQLSPFKKVATPQKLRRIPMGTWDEESMTDSNSLQQIVDDPRRCLFCGVFGDQKPSEAGRLLYAHQDDWVHVNCALWSAEVFEEVDGTLQHVNIAVKRGKMLKCDHCLKLGATVGCCQKGCQSNYHFMCARYTDCVFQEDKVVYCRTHRYSVLQKMVSEDNFEVQRRACVELDLTRFLKKSWQKGLPPDSISVLAGSMTLESMGWLTPSSDCKTTLFPVGYCVTRVYWSMIDARRRCIYTCRIVEVKPVHQVTAPVVADMTIVHDRSHPKYSSAAEKAFEERIVADARSRESNDEAEPMSVGYCDGIDEAMAWQSSGGTARVSEAPEVESRIPAITSSMSTSDGRPITQELAKRKPPGIDLSRLSASTLRLLGKAATSLAQANISTDACTDNELQLTTIVDRLNEAAAKNKRSQRSRENSVDGSGSSNHSGSNSREGSVERSSVVRPVAVERVSLQPNLERVAETDASSPSVWAPPKQPQPLGLCTITNRPQTQNTIGFGAMRTAESSRGKTTASYGSSISVLRTSECQPQTDKSGDKFGLARTVNGTGQMCASVVSVSPSKAYNLMKSEKDSGKLTVRNVVASTSDSGFDSGDKRLASGAEVVRTLNSSVNRTRYRVVPVVTTQSNHAKSVCKVVTKPATVPSIVSSLMHQRSLSSSARQPILMTLSNHAKNDRNAVTKTASTVLSVTHQRDKPSSSTQPILTTVSNRTKNVTRTVSVSPVPSVTPSVTCHANNPSSSAQPKLSPPFAKTTFLDAFKDHISQEARHKIRHPLDVVKQARARVMHNINGTRQEPVYNKHGVLVGHYLVKNSGAARPSSPSELLTRYTTVTLDGGAASQQPSDCYASNDKDDLVIENIVQLDGSRDVKPRDAKDVSTSRSIANGYNNDNDIPLHDKIARKIKAESLARSIASDAGPFKCPKCKRLYRTQESCERHAMSCDFEVSTSEEEEDDDEDGEVSFKSQFQTVEQLGDVADATNCVTTDSSHLSASEYVSCDSDPIVDGEETTPTDDTVTDDSVSYQRQSSRTTSSSSETSLIASSLKHRQESSVIDVTAMNNGDRDRSCDVVEEQGVRTLRRGRSRSSIDATIPNCDVNPVVSPLRVHCDPNPVFIQSPPTQPVKPKRGRGRPRKVPRNQVVAVANTDNRVKSPTECLRKYGLRTDGVRLPTGLDTPEGCDMARMINCTVDVCQLEMKSPTASGSRVEDSRKCQSMSVDDKPLISNDHDVIIIDDDSSPSPDTGTPEDTEMPESLPITPDTGDHADCEMSETLQNLAPDTAVNEIINFPTETNIGPHKSPGASSVSIATANVVDECDHDTSSGCPVPDLQDHPILARPPLHDDPHCSQQLHNSCTDLVQNVENDDGGLRIDAMTQSDRVDETSPGMYVLETDTVAVTGGSNDMTSTDQEYVALTDAVSRTGIVIPSLDVNNSEISSLPSSHTDIAVSGHASPNNLEEPAGDMCYLEEPTNDNESPGSNDTPSDTTVCVSDSCDTTTKHHDSCPTVFLPTKAEESYEANGLCHTEIPVSNDVHRTDYMPKSLQLLHKSPSSHSASNVGLLQPTPWQKPILPSPLRHLEASGQINYFGSFIVNSHAPQLLLSGASLPVGQHPLLVMSSLDGGATTAVQGPIAISDPAQIAAAYNSGGALSTAPSAGYSAVQTEYIQGLQYWATIGASHLPQHSVLSRQHDAVAMPGASSTPTSHCLTSDSVSTVTPCGSSVCDTLKSFVQANISRSVRTCQSIEMSTIGVPSVHYKQGMHVPHARTPPQTAAQTLSHVRSSLLPSLLAAREKKRVMPAPIDHVDLYKKAKLHPMAPPVAQSKHRKAVGRPKKLSSGEPWKLNVQRTYSDASILTSGRHAKVGSEQKRYKSLHSSVFGKEDRGHIMSEHSHPLIHTSYQQTSLPEAELEEEVVESKPVLTPGDSEASEPCQRDRDSPYLKFEITSDDGFSVQADTCEDAWKAVTERVQDARANARMKQLSFAGVNGLQMFGLNHAVIVQLLEQLQGAKYCRNYHFEYHTYDHRDNDEEPVENPSGVARSEPFVGRKNQEMFSFLLSQYRIKPQLPSPLAPKDGDMVHKSQRRATSLDLPMAMRFRHLRQNAKQACDVYRSDIHGRGLFCKRDIDAGEMIIEYAGEVIRSAMTDRREHFYESKGIGCYMFRIDDLEVVDATMKGSAARFINHSCDPSCYSKVIQVDGKKHIIIFAMKAIKRGEELTYDYKFPIEDVKIPCTCGTKRCRRYLN